MSPLLEHKTIAVIGGTGAEGSGLAFRWAAAGLHVVIGSRDLDKARAMAETLNARLGRHVIGYAANADAAADADFVVLAVPYAAQQATAMALREALAGKVLVDVTVPLQPPRVDRVALPNGRSAVAQLAEQLGPAAKVAAAFQNVGAHRLMDLDHTIDCDVLVCADDADARAIAMGLAETAGLVGIDAGALANAAAVEAMTSLLIAINKRYKVKGSGIRITGLPPRNGDG